jgi:hypothetical protein
MSSKRPDFLGQTTSQHQFNSVGTEFLYWFLFALNLVSRETVFLAYFEL